MNGVEHAPGIIGHQLTLRGAIGCQVLRERVPAFVTQGQFRTRWRRRGLFAFRIGGRDIATSADMRQNFAEARSIRHRANGARYFSEFICRRLISVRARSLCGAFSVQLTSRM